MDHSGLLEAEGAGVTVAFSCCHNLSRVTGREGRRVGKVNLVPLFGVHCSVFILF